MSRHTVEPYSFDEKQQDDKAFLRNSLTEWQQNNRHRIRVNSDTAIAELGNAVNFIGEAHEYNPKDWYLGDLASVLRLDFSCYSDWSTHCPIEIKVKNSLSYKFYNKPY